MFKPENVRKTQFTGRMYFFVLAVFFLIYLCVVQPEMMFGGEMYAEMGVNYYPNATSDSWLSRLFSTDFGYVPFFLRVVAWLGNAFHLSAAQVPYFYTWFGSLFLIGVVGLFCFKSFEPVLKSASHRFLVSLAILLTADFESRVFFNITYFSAFPICVLTLLAWETKRVPVWAWGIPLLICAKPAVLSALPVMLWVSWSVCGRFRYVTWASVIVAVMQCGVLFVSHTVGAGDGIADYGLLEVILSTCGNFLGLLDGFLLGKAFYFHQKLVVIVLGVGIFSFLLWTLWRAWKTEKILAFRWMVLGLGIFFFNTFLDSLALPLLWNTHFDQLHTVPLSRHVILNVMGAVLIVVGLGLFWFWGNEKKQRWFFIGWWVISLWLVLGLSMGARHKFPVFGSSAWEAESTLIDQRDLPVCVPISPLGWLYGRKCGVLNNQFWINWHDGLYFAATAVRTQSVIPPDFPGATKLISLAIGVLPAEKHKKISITADLINTKGRVVTTLSGVSPVRRGGNLVTLFNPSLNHKPIPLSEVARVDFHFNSSVHLAFTGDGKQVLFWMGSSEKSDLLRTT